MSLFLFYLVFLLLFFVFTVSALLRYKQLNFSRFFCVYLKISTEKAMAPHSSTLAWKIPRTEEPGRLQSMGLLRVGHN